MLHWGSHGVARNLREAAELYRLGAQGDDPVANYDYGVVLLRVGFVLCLRGQMFASLVLRCEFEFRLVISADRKCTEHVFRGSRKAVKQSWIHRLNLCFWQGQGTTQNFSKALHHLDKSAAKVSGHGDASLRVVDKGRGHDMCSSDVDRSLIGSRNPFV